jgi:hypothetical protein
VGDLALLDRPQRFLGIELRQEDDAPSHMLESEQPARPRHERKRRAGEIDVVAGQAELERGRHGGGHQVSVGQHHPLRGAGRSARVDQDRDVGLFDRNRFRRGYGRKRLPFRRSGKAGRASVDGGEVDDGGQAGPDPLGYTPELFGKKECLHLGVPEDCGEFTGDQQFAERRKDRPDLRDRVQNFHVRRGVPYQDRHPVAFPMPRFRRAEARRATRAESSRYVMVASPMARAMRAG